MWRGVFDMGTVRNPRAPKIHTPSGEPPELLATNFPDTKLTSLVPKNGGNPHLFFNFRYVICISKAYVREFPHSLKQP